MICKSEGRYYTFYVDSIVMSDREKQNCMKRICCSMNMLKKNILFKLGWSGNDSWRRWILSFILLRILNTFIIVKLGWNQLYQNCKYIWRIFFLNIRGNQMKPFSVRQLMLTEMLLLARIIKKIPDGLGWIYLSSWIYHSLWSLGQEFSKSFPGLFCFTQFWQCHLGIQQQVGRRDGPWWHLYHSFGQPERQHLTNDG